MTLMTLDTCLAEALPVIEAYAEHTGDVALVELCQRAAKDRQVRLAIWSTMLIWCAQYHGVVQALQRAVDKLDALDLEGLEPLPKTPITH